MIHPCDDREPSRRAAAKQGPAVHRRPRRGTLAAIDGGAHTAAIGAPQNHGASDAAASPIVAALHHPLEITG